MCWTVSELCWKLCWSKHKCDAVEWKWKAICKVQVSQNCTWVNVPHYTLSLGATVFFTWPVKWDPYVMYMNKLGVEFWLLWILGYSHSLQDCAHTKYWSKMAQGMAASVLCSPLLPVPGAMWNQCTCTHTKPILILNMCRLQTSAETFYSRLARSPDSQRSGWRFQPSLPPEIMRPLITDHLWKK